MAGEQSRVVVRGSGVAAGIVSMLLAHRGDVVQLDCSQPRSRRVVSLPLETAALLEDLLGHSIDQLVAGFWSSGRRVAWQSRDFSIVAAPSFICDDAQLSRIIIDRFRERFGMNTLDPGTVDWEIVARGGRSSDHVVRAGRRRAVSGRFDDPSEDLGDATVIAATSEGWLYACRHPEGGGFAAVVQPPEVSSSPPEGVLQAALAEVWRRRHVVLPDGIEASDSAPVLNLSSACQPTIIVGDAALRIDPLRGDGVGYGARGALLAQSVVAGISRFGDARRYLAHYQSRLVDVFVRHLRSCISHYALGWNAGIWREEIDRMSTCLADVGPAPAMGMRLIGRELHAIENDAAHSGATM